MPFTYELAVLPLDKIDLGERRRQDYGDIEGLAESFDTCGVGMMQTITVQRMPDNPDRYKLIAGGRRYMASLLRKELDVPARIMPPDVDEETLRTLELLENVQRKDFEWHERVTLEAEVHELRKRKDPNWKQQDTAGLLNRKPAAISESLQLNNILKNAPPEALLNAKNMSEARIILSKLKRDAQRKKVAEIAVAKHSAAPVDLMYLADNYIVDDALEGMKRLEKETFHFIEIDPPYGIDYVSKVSKGTTLTYTEVPDSEYTEFITTVATEAYRVARADAFCVLWMPIQRYMSNLHILNDAGWVTQKCPLVWYKPGACMVSSKTLHLARSYEVALYAHKGNPKLNIMGHSDTFTYPTLGPNRRIHPTERPVELMKELLSVFCAPGSLILSPFLGSGVTIYAANTLNMTALGFDLEEQHKLNFIAKLTSGWNTYTHKEHNDECILPDESSEGNC